MLSLQVRVDLRIMTMKGYSPHSSKLQNWNFTIRLFSVISRTLIGGGSYPSAEMQSVNSTALDDWARLVWMKLSLFQTSCKSSLVGTQLDSFHYSIIIIMSRRLRGYPWPSLAISPYHSSPPAGLQGYIPCPHIAAVCKFVLVVPLLHIHVWGSTGVHRLWARPCFSSSVLRVWFVELV